jgi:AAA15 family ATPase/GTPase
MLGLALAVVCTKGGVLLVDEIDTGLHFTTMISMWKMISETAKNLNVQVFVTTHSRDCWESLAEVAEMEHFQNNEIMIHRIEKGKSESVLFDPRQMAIAAEEGIEVR